MPRPRTAFQLVTFIAVAFVASTTAPRLCVAVDPADAGARARMSLADIPSPPQFNESTAGTLVRPADLTGADRRAWRDAEARYAEGRWPAAIEKLDVVIATHPGCAEALVLRARCYGRQGQTDQAVADLAAALRAAPRHVAAHELAGETALLVGDQAGAIGSFRSALEADPSEPNAPDRLLAVLFLARTLEPEGYLAAAAALYGEFLEATETLTPEMRRNDRLREMAESTPSELRRRIAAIHSRLNDWNAAAESWRRVIEGDENDASAWRELAWAEARRGDGKAAFDSMNRYLAAARLGAAMIDELSALCDMLPAGNDCESRIDEAVEKFADAELSLTWAERCRTRGRDEAARRIFAAAARTFPDRPDVQYSFATYCAARESEAAFFDALVNAARTESEPGRRLPAALEAVRSIVDVDKLVKAGAARVRADSGNSTASLVLSQLLLAQKQTDTAIKELERLTRDQPNSPATWSALCEALIERLDWPGALDAANRAADADVETARIACAKGIAHDALSDDDAAIEAFESAMQLDPSFLPAYLGRARLAERVGRKMDAERIYRRILSDVDPDCAEARESLIIYYLNTGAFAQAQSLFGEMSKRHADSPAHARCAAMIDLLSAGNQDAEKRLTDYLAKLRAILRDHPNDADTYVELAKTYIAVSRFKDAVVELESAVRADSRHVGAMELLAETHARLLDFTAAETVIERLLIHRPRDLRYIDRRIEYANDRGDAGATISQLRALIARDDLAEHRDRFTRQLVDELRADDRYDEAVRVAKGWLDGKPDDFYRRNLYLEMLALSGRHDEAVKIAQSYVSEKPDDRLSQIQLLANLQSAKRSIEAIQYATEWLAEAPADVDLTAALIRLCWSAKRWDDAIEIARAAAEDTEQPSPFDRLLIETYQHAGRTDDAIDLRRRQARRYELLLEHAGNSPQRTTLVLRHRQSQYDVVSTYLAGGRYAEAERYIDALLSPVAGGNVSADQSYVIDLRNLLSEVYRLSDRTDQAIEQLEEIHQLTPQDDGANNNLGYTLADAGRDIDRAETMVRYALSQNPQSSASLDSLGWVHYKQGKFDEAAYYLRRALRIAQYGDPVIFDHLGDALYRMNKPDEAVRMWRKSADICDPNGDPPPPPDRVALGRAVRAKCDAYAADASSVKTAPLASKTPATMPAERSEPRP